MTRGETVPAPPTAAPEPEGSRRDLIAAVAVGIASLALSWWTLSRVVYWGDSAELAVVGPLLDIAHPTGYPLFTLLAKLFHLVLPGPDAMRVNAVSAVAGAAASGLAVLVARRVGLGRIPAVGAGLLLAVSRELWEQSTAAEVYSLQTALTAALLLAALGFHRRPSPGRWRATAFLLGLSFTNHLTTLWSVPAVAWLLGSRLLRGGADRDGTWRPARSDVLAAAGLFAAGLSLYLYLPIRSWTGPLFDQGQVGSFGNLVEHVSGSQFRYRMFADTELSLEDELGAAGQAVADQLGWWALPFAAIGLVSLWRWRRGATVGLALLAGANLAFALEYHIPDKSGYYLPVHLVLCLSTAAGAEALASRLRVPVARGLAAGVPLVALAVVAGFVDFRRVDKSDNRSLPEYTEALLDPLPEGALVLVDNQDLMWSASHADLVRHEPVGAMVVSDYWLCVPWYVAHLRRRYPELVLPESVDRLVEQRAADVAGVEGREVGRISREYSTRIAEAIARANLSERPVFLAFSDFDERKSWQGLALVDHGLCYELSAEEEPPPAEPWALDYPDPERYRVQELEEPRHRFVASSFATSCNRCGIVFVRLGRYEEAEAAFLRALEYDADYAQVHLNLGVVYHQFLPDAEKRDRYWRRFLELDPTHPQAESVRRSLAAAAK